MPRFIVSLLAASAITSVAVSAQAASYQLVEANDQDVVAIERDTVSKNSFIMTTILMAPMQLPHTRAYVIRELIKYSCSGTVSHLGMIAYDRQGQAISKSGPGYDSSHNADRGSALANAVSAACGHKIKYSSTITGLSLVQFENSVLNK